MMEIPFDTLGWRAHQRILMATQAALKSGKNNPEGLSQHRDANLAGFFQEVSRKSAKWRSYFDTPWASEPDMLRRLLGLRPTTRDQIVANRRLQHADRGAFFSIYAEYTSGHTDGPFQIFRPSHSQHREMLRLRYALDYYSAQRMLPHIRHVLFVSHYPNAQAYTHIDRTAGSLKIEKVPLAGETMSHNLHTGNDSGAIALAGTPSSLAYLIDNYPVWTERLAEQVHLIVSSGEHLPQTLQERLGDAFEAPVAELYVMREFGLLGFGCTAGPGLHIFEGDHVMLTQQSKIYVTDMTNTLDVFINYATGDSGNLAKMRRCACGEVMGLLTGFEGRAYGKPYLPASIGW